MRCAAAGRQRHATWDKPMLDPTRYQDRRDRRTLFAIGIALAFVLAVAVIAGPVLVSRFFPGDGTGSRGNPTHTQPVQPRTS
jgi:hypothetical protein